MWCVSPSFALACRPSPQQHFAQRRRKPELSELAVLGVVGCSSFVFVVRQHRRPSMLRRNRLTPRPSGRLRRRLTQALVGSSWWFFVWCVSPSFALACRSSPQQLLAQHRRKSGHSELVVLGQSVVQAVRSSWQSLSHEHAASQPSNISSKRTREKPRAA